MEKPIMCDRNCRFFMESARQDETQPTDGGLNTFLLIETVVCAAKANRPEVGSLIRKFKSPSRTKSVEMEVISGNPAAERLCLAPEKKEPLPSVEEQLKMRLYRPSSGV